MSSPVSGVKTGARGVGGSGGSLGQGRVSKKLTSEFALQISRFSTRNC